MSFETNTAGLVVLWHNDKELESLSQLNGMCDEFGSAVPLGRDIPNHQHRRDFAANTGGFEVSTDGGAMNNLFSQGTKLRNS